MKKLFLFWTLFFFPISANSVVEHFPHGDGVISLHNVHLHETLAIRYRRGNRYFPEALEEINHLLRCRGSQEPTDMALPLIEIVDHLQDHFGAETVEVISGYRSPAFNAALKRQGRRVASRSRHMYGQAMDIRLPGVNMWRVRQYLVSLQTGGVGYYGANNFVHVDVGPFRTW